MSKQKRVLSDIIKEFKREKFRNFERNLTENYGVVKSMLWRLNNILFPLSFFVFCNPLMTDTIYKQIVLNLFRFVLNIG